LYLPCWEEVREKTLVVLLSSHLPSNLSSWSRFMIVIPHVLCTQPPVQDAMALGIFGFPSPSSQGNLRPTNFSFLFFFSAANVSASCGGRVSLRNSILSLAPIRLTKAWGLAKKACPDRLAPHGSRCRWWPGLDRSANGDNIQLLQKEREKKEKNPVSRQQSDLHCTYWSDSLSYNEFPTQTVSYRKHPNPNLI